MRAISRGLLTIAFLVPTSVVTAQVAGTCNDPLAALDARLRALEAQNQQLIGSLNQCQVGAQANQPDFLGTPRHNGLIMGIEVLHLAVRHPGLEFGITDTSGGLQDSGADGTVLGFDGDYDIGWRATLGYRFDADCFCEANRPEFLLRYTIFGTEQDESFNGLLRASFISADNSENNDSDDGVNDITPDDRATNAQASFDFDLETLDLEFAQTLSLTRTLNLRLAAIGRFALIDEDYRVTYSGADFSNPFTAFRQWDYQGGGLMLGSQLDWQLSNRISLTCGGRAGALLGRRESRYFIPDDEAGLPTDVLHSTTRLTPVLEMAAMLNYTRDYCNFGLNIAAGYEFTNYFNLADDRTFTDPHQEAVNVNSVRDLSLDGFVGRISLNY